MCNVHACQKILFDQGATILKKGRKELDTYKTNIDAKTKEFVCESALKEVT